jgi:hypothetical protein
MLIMPSTCLVGDWMTIVQCSGEKTRLQLHVPVEGLQRFDVRVLYVMQQRGLMPHRGVRGRDHTTSGGTL